MPPFNPSIPSTTQTPSPRIADAVALYHRGRLIHGYLLERPGRRKHPRVLDYRQRVWRVPNARLTRTDRHRCRVLMTPHDGARTGWTLGDPVTFDLRWSLQQGTIAKFNPKRAVVQCRDRHWSVPYADLHHPQGSPGARRTNRRHTIAALARDLMDAHGLDDWTLAFVESRRRLGECWYDHQLIRIARHHAIEDPEPEIRDTVLHEIAHALAGHAAGHGPVWKAIARRIGATPQAKAYDRAPA